MTDSTEGPLVRRLEAAGLTSLADAERDAGVTPVDRELCEAVCDETASAPTIRRTLPRCAT